MVVTLLGMFQFCLSIIVHHLILTIVRIIFLELGEGPTHNIDDSVGTADKKFSINFTKAKTKIFFECTLQWR